MKTISQVTIDIYGDHINVYHVGIAADTVGSDVNMLEGRYPVAKLPDLITTLTERGYVKMSDAGWTCWWQKVADDGALPAPD